MLTIALLYVAGFIHSAMPLPGNGYEVPQQKILNITIEKPGLAILSPDTLPLEELAKELRTRLWKSYLGTGKMQDGIRLHFAEDLPAEMKNTAIEEVNKAQTMALNDVCLQMHKKQFAALTPDKQAKLRKKFPILFQADFETGL